MKPSLHLNLGQNVTLTPQLQQAIRLLQMSTIDLQQEIQNIIESNPMLEETPVTSEEETSLTDDETAYEAFDDLQWSHLYQNARQPNNFNENDYNFDNLHSTTTSLQDHLKWQLNLTPMSDVDLVIGTTIIEAIGDDGFLTMDLEELQNCLSSDAHPIAKEEIEAVRHRIQQFDPIGCGSYSLAESLIVQLNQQGESVPYFDICKKIITNDLELLGQHQYQSLIKKYRIDNNILKTIIDHIQHLTPRPGDLIHQNTTEYVIPDLSAKKVNGQWRVTLNQEILPQLNINQQYASLIKKTKNPADNKFLKNNLQEAKWFLKSIQSRQDTLLKVGSCIVNYQKEFLENGEEAMKPLVLSDIARVLDMHESTISRVTTQKYLHTPRGVFELKYFFSSHVNTVSGGECSSTAIRAVIKRLIDAENRAKPLSDNKIMQLLKEQGIKLARRTVAKYREALGFAPSHERKELK